MLYEPSEARAAFCTKLETSAKRETRGGETNCFLLFFFSLRIALRALRKMPHLPRLALKGPVMQAMGVRQVLNTRDPKPYVLFISRFAYWLQIFGKHFSFFMVNIEVTIIRNFNRGFN